MPRSMELSDRRNRVCVEPVSAQAMWGAVKKALLCDAISLIRLHVPTRRGADFTAGPYVRVRLRRWSPGVAVDPLATEDGVVALICASVYVVLSASILKQVLP